MSACRLNSTSSISSLLQDMSETWWKICGISEHAGMYVRIQKSHLILCTLQLWQPSPLIARNIINIYRSAQKELCSLIKFLMNEEGSVIASGYREVSRIEHTLSRDIRTLITIYQWSNKENDAATKHH